MAPKISEFMIGIVIMGFFVAVFGIFMAELNSNYGVPYDNSSIQAYNQLNEISVQAEEIKDATDIKEKPGILDIIGGYFSDGYQALLLTKKSFNTFDEMSNQAIEDANLGATGKYLRIMISTIILIMIFVAVILSALLKKDL